MEELKSLRESLDNLQVIREALSLEGDDEFIPRSIAALEGEIHSLAEKVKALEKEVVAA